MATEAVSYCMSCKWVTAVDRSDFEDTVHNVCNRCGCSVGFKLAQWPDFSDFRIVEHGYVDEENVTSFGELYVMRYWLGERPYNDERLTMMKKELAPKVKGE